MRDALERGDGGVSSRAARFFRLCHNCWKKRLSGATSSRAGSTTRRQRAAGAPTIRDLVDSYEIGFEKHGYRGDARDNLLAALKLRLDSLTRGARGLLLDTVESVDFEELMARPAVIELDHVADHEDKSMLAAFLLERVRAAARRRGSTSGALKHVTVLEEAHRMLSRSGVEAESPQSAAIRTFCDAIAELRALGEGFIVSSQSPSALAEAAVANTGTRILHRLESAADRDVVLADLDATPSSGESPLIQRRRGVVRWPQLDESRTLRVTAADGVDSGRVVSDEDVRERMAADTEVVRRLLPYRLCTRKVCTRGCDVAVRSKGRILARDVAKDAHRVERAPGENRCARSIVDMLADQGTTGLQDLYCGAAHLAAEVCLHRAG